MKKKMKQKKKEGEEGEETENYEEDGEEEDEENEENEDEGGFAFIIKYIKSSSFFGGTLTTVRTMFMQRRKARMQVNF